MWVQIPGFLTMRNRVDDRPTADVGAVINLGDDTRAHRRQDDDYG